MEQQAVLNCIGQNNKQAEELVTFIQNELPPTYNKAVDVTVEANEQNQSAPSVIDEKPKAEAQNVEKKDSKKEKKEKELTAAKEEKHPADDKAGDVSRLDLRIGRILSVKKHSDAESLYVEEIDFGEKQPKSVKFVTLEERQNRLKEVKFWSDVSFNLNRFINNIPQHSLPSSNSRPTSTLKTEAVTVEANEQNQSAPSVIDEKPKAEAQNVEKKDSKKEKKEKELTAAKEEKPPADDKAVDVSRLDLRIGRILSVKKHSDTESLYVEEIDVGEEHPRTVVSDLVKFVPLEEMQNRLVIVLCNLKPTKIQEVTSQAMVMCASTPEKLEILVPPANCVPGDRVICKDFPGDPDSVLPPQKKIFEQVAPDLKTNDGCLATYKSSVLEVADKGAIKALSLTNGTTEELDQHSSDVPNHVQVMAEVMCQYQHNIKTLEDKLSEALEENMKLNEQIQDLYPVLGTVKTLDKAVAMLIEKVKSLEIAEQTVEEMNDTLSKLKEFMQRTQPAVVQDHKPKSPQGTKSPESTSPPHGLFGHNRSFEDHKPKHAAPPTDLYKKNTRIS